MKEELITTLAIVGVLLGGQSVRAQSISASSEAQTLRGNIVWPMANEAKFVAENTQNTITQAKLSEIAARKGRSNEVRGLASQMLDQNNMATASLQTLAGAKSVIMPYALDSAHQWRVTRITDLPKDIFNVAYLAQLNEDQVEELSALENLPANLDPSLKTWAEQRKDALRNDIVRGAWVGVKRHADRVHVAVNPLQESYF